MKKYSFVITAAIMVLAIVSAFTALSLTGCSSPTDPAATDIAINPAVVNAIKGKLKQKQLTIIANSSGGVTWTVEDSGTTGEGTINVDANGLLTVNTSALAGTAIIRATLNSDNTVYGETAVNVLVQGDGTAPAPYLVDDGPALASIGGA